MTEQRKERLHDLCICGHPYAMHGAHGCDGMDERGATDTIRPCMCHGFAKPPKSDPVQDKRATHTLKTEHDAWMAVRDGSKTAEFRRDDRGFKVGDLLRLKHGTDLATGLVLHRCITHIVRGPAFGIPEGYAMLSLAMPRCKHGKTTAHREWISLMGGDMWEDCLGPV